MAEFQRAVQSHVIVRSLSTATLIPYRPFLEINGVHFPVKLATPTYQEEFVGQQRRTYNGNLRSGIRRRRRVFHVETPLLPLDEAFALYDVLTSPPPLEVSTFMFQTDRALLCHIGPISGGYHRGGLVGQVGGLRDLQLQTLVFDIIPE